MNNLSYSHDPIGRYQPEKPSPGDERFASDLLNACYGHLTRSSIYTQRAEVNLPYVPIGDELLDPVLMTGYAYTVPDERQQPTLGVLREVLLNVRRDPLRYDIRILRSENDSSQVRYLIISRHLSNNDPDRLPNHTGSTRRYKFTPLPAQVMPDRSDNNIRPISDMPGHAPDPRPARNTLAIDLTLPDEQLPSDRQVPYINLLSFGYFIEGREANSEPDDSNIIQLRPFATEE